MVRSTVEPALWRVLLGKHRGFVICFAGLILLFLAPLLTSDLLPFVDYPRHVGELRVLTDLSRGDALAAELYAVDRWYHPYNVHRYLLLPLARVTSAETAYRWYAGLPFVLGPLAVVGLLLRLRRSPWPAVLAFAGLYSYPVVYGFVTFAVGASLLLVVYWVWERPVRGSGWARAAVLGFLGLLILGVHAQAYVQLAVTLTVLAVLRAAGTGEGWRPAAVTVASLIPGALGFAVQWRSSIHASVEILTGQLDLPSLAGRLVHLPAQLGAVWSGGAHTFVLAALAVVLAVLVLAETPRGSSGRDADTGLYHHRYAVLAALYVLGALVLPWNFYLAPRLPAMAVALLPLAVSSTPVWRRRVTVILVTGLVAVLGCVVVWHMGELEAETRDFGPVLGSIPEGSRYRCQISDPRSEVLDLPVYRHFCGHLLARRGGLDGFMFANLGIDYRPAVAITPATLLYGWQDDPSGFDFDRYGDLYDYYIVRGAEVRHRYLDGPPADHLETVLHSGSWTVFRRVRAFAPDEGAAPSEDSGPAILAGAENEAW